MRRHGKGDIERGWRERKVGKEREGSWSYWRDGVDFDKGDSEGKENCMCVCVCVCVFVT